jgi:hypothetical protein
MWLRQGGICFGKKQRGTNRAKESGKSNQVNGRLESEDLRLVVTPWGNLRNKVDVFTGIFRNSIAQD